MSHDPPVPRQDTRQDTRSDGVATVQWGQDDPPGRGRGNRLLAAIGRDSRLGPVTAGLGVVAVSASLIGEWTITTIPNAGPNGSADVRLQAGVSEIPNFGTAYLVGVLTLVGCLALVFFGAHNSAASAVRHNARVVGLAISGGLLVVLTATTISVHNTAERQLVYGAFDDLRMEYGRGLVMAYIGTATLGLALLLAGRFVQRSTAPGTDRLPAGSPDPDQSDGGPEQVDDDGWPWRRSRPTAEPELAGGHSAPIDLTVAPAVPFARTEQQDQR